MHKVLIWGTEAEHVGISEDILFTANIFLLPAFDFEKYIKLSKSKIYKIGQIVTGSATGRF